MEYLAEKASCSSVYECNEDIFLNYDDKILIQGNLFQLTGAKVWTHTHTEKSAHPLASGHEPLYLFFLQRECLRKIRCRILQEGVLKLNTSRVTRADQLLTYIPCTFHVRCGSEHDISNVVQDVTDIILFQYGECNNQFLTN